MRTPQLAQEENVVGLLGKKLPLRKTETKRNRTCGSDPEFCSLDKGCQPQYGACYSKTSNSDIFGEAVGLNEGFDDSSRIFDDGDYDFDESIF